MILTVSNEFLLEYVLNNGVFIGDPQVIVKGQMFTLTNLANQGIPPAGSMVFTIVANEGETFFMPTPAGGSYNYTVNWGDSMQDDITDENGSHLFAAGGVYVVWLSGICSDFAFSDITESNHMIYAVQNLGNLVYNSLSFWLGSNLLSVISGTDCDTSSIVNFDRLFSGCVDLIECDLEGFDTSNATDFVGMFFGCAALADFDHSQLDMTLATNVSNMFSGCVAMLDPAPEWWNIETITQFEDCFLNNLLRPNYEDIPNDWKGAVTSQLFVITETASTRRAYTSYDGGDTWISRTPFAGAGAGAQISGCFATKDGQHICINDRISSSQNSENVSVSHDYGETWNPVLIAGGADGVSHNISPDGQIIISPRWAVTDPFISFDGGENWSVAIAGRMPFGCGSLDMQYIYFAGDTATSYKSVDFGASFQVASGFVSRRGSVICSEDGQTLFQTSSHAVVTPYVSKDYGETFAATIGIGARQGHIIMSPDGTKAFFYPTISGTQSLFSVDGGLNFSNSVGLPAARPYASACGSYFISDSGVIVAYVGNVSYYSLDFGATFTEGYDFTPHGTVIANDIPHNGLFIVVLVQTATPDVRAHVAPIEDPTNFVETTLIPNGIWRIYCY